MKPRWQKGSYPLNAEGVAIQGYDPVAYFTQGKAMRGKPELATNWSGAIWRFANESHRETFLAAPETYAPQSGGYCAFAVSFSANPSAPPAPPGSPRWWTIREGKLYLNQNPFAHLMFKLFRLAKKADTVWEQFAG
ncbi:MAG: YHS domain protein [Caldilinea sp. CFX5]|nr:YHS domain protein [Caldilinea sp. CFX5]